MLARQEDVALALQQDVDPGGAADGRGRGVQHVEHAEGVHIGDGDLLPGDHRPVLDVQPVAENVEVPFGHDGEGFPAQVGGHGGGYLVLEVLREGAAVAPAGTVGHQELDEPLAV